jgi:hypothetical protein
MRRCCLIEKARAAGRPVYLASASNEKFVAAVAHQLGLFDGWFASDASSNLSAEVKARRLTEAFGRGGFDYIGNEKADLPVWAAAAGRIGIRTSPKLNGRLAALGVEVLDSPKADLRQWLKLIRVHQYAKNALVFLPLLTAHKFGLGSLFHAALAAVAFSLCASSVYILNDLVDPPPTATIPRREAGRLPRARSRSPTPSSSWESCFWFRWRLRPLSPGLSSAFSRSTMC